MYTSMSCFYMFLNKLLLVQLKMNIVNNFIQGGPKNWTVFKSLQLLYKKMFHRSNCSVLTLKQN